MTGFSKLFGSMWQGSMYGRFEASAIMMVMLSLCNRDGEVDMTPEAIAGTTGWPLDFIKTGLAELAEPDSRSRTPDCDGRRIILIDGHRDWGWRITNYAKYRDEMRSQERREYLREAQRKRRAKLSTTVNKSTNVNQNQPIADADADADADAEKEKKARKARSPIPEGLNQEAWERWVAYRAELKKPLRSASTEAAMRKLAGFGNDQMAVVEQSIANGWQGLFSLKDDQVRNGSGKAKPRINQLLGDDPWGEREDAQQ